MNKSEAQGDSCLVEIKRIVEHCNPLQVPVWHLDAPVRESMIRECVTTNQLKAEVYTVGKSTWSEFDHASRIAYFLVHGWDDPIHIHVGVPSILYYDVLNPLWFVCDGNHRLTAAIVRGDKFIWASLSGCFDTLKCLLGVDLDAPQHEAA